MKDIKVEMFALCQGAHDLKGHLTVVNTMDEFHVASFPARISFGLAIKLYVRPNVEGDKNLHVSIIDKSCKGKENDDSCGFPFPVLKTDFRLERLDRPSHVNIAFNLQNVLFEHEGTYDIHFELDGTRLDDFAFDVIKV